MERQGLSTQCEIRLQMRQEVHKKNQALSRLSILSRQHLPHNSHSRYFDDADIRTFRCRPYTKIVKRAANQDADPHLGGSRQGQRRSRNFYVSRSTSQNSLSRNEFDSKRTAQYGMRTVKMRVLGNGILNTSQGSCRCVRFCGWPDKARGVCAGAGAG